MPVLGIRAQRKFILASFRFLKIFFWCKLKIILIVYTYLLSENRTIRTNSLKIIKNIAWKVIPLPSARWRL